MLTQEPKTRYSVVCVATMSPAKSSGSLYSARFEHCSPGRLHLEPDFGAPSSRLQSRWIVLEFPYRGGLWPTATTAQR